MPEVSQYLFTYREIVEALIKKQSLHEGAWGIYVEFGIAGANGPGLNPGENVPLAVVPVLKIGLQRATGDEQKKLLPGVCDAAEVNPPSSSAHERPSSQSPSAS